MSPGDLVRVGARVGLVCAGPMPGLRTTPPRGLDTVLIYFGDDHYEEVWRSVPRLVLPQ